MDEIIVGFRLDMDKNEADLQKYEATLLDVQKTTKATGTAGTKAFSDQTKQVKSLTDATQKQTKTVTTLSDQLKNISNQLPFANQINQVIQLGSAVTGLGGAAQKSSIGFQILKTAIISTGIGALVIGIIALISYFKRTDEGAAKLSGVMSALGAATDLVTGFVVGLGDSLFTALTSVEGFKQGLSDLGDFIINNLLNRLKAPIVAFQALQLAIGGDFKAASLKFIDATTQLATGITDITQKTGSFVDKASAASAAAYEWELRMDSLEDKIRSDSTAIAENDRAITKLIIASKNKNIEDEKALGFLDEATRLEKQNLAVTLQNERAKLALIKEKNKRELESITQDGKQRSINDALAQEEVNQINKIIQIQQASDNLLEKVQNRRDSKEEEIFQNQIKRISQEEILRENAAKEAYLIGTTTAEQYEDALYQIKLDGLNAQKELLVTDSRDIVDVDKAILDLQLANLDKHNKSKAALEKEARDNKAKADKTANDALLAAIEERLKREDELAAQHEANLKTIKQTGFQLADELAKGFADISAQKRQQELDGELQKSQIETDTKIAANQKQLDQGIISQEQFDARKAALDKKQADKEADIKKKKYQADKKAALIQIAIDTALAIAKAFAQLGPIGGVLGAALAAAMGIAQAALVSSQPTPKFKDGKINIKGKGTGKSDSIHAMISNGESVIKASATARNNRLLESINSGTEDKFINSTYVIPAVERMQREAVSRREAKEKETARRYEMAFNNNMDMSDTNRLLKKNGNVNLNNTSEIAKKLAQEFAYNNQWYR